MYWNMLNMSQLVHNDIHLLSHREKTPPYKRDKINKFFNLKNISSPILILIYEAFIPYLAPKINILSSFLLAVSSSSDLT